MHIKVTAATQYGGTSESVPVNQSPIHLDTKFGPVDVAVRIKGFKNDGEEVTSKYFEERPNVNFSIQFTFTPSQDIKGDQLLWGNDFDTPIRDLLPWGFSAAFATFKRLVDPSVEGDVYADKPYLYGPCLSSINYLKEGQDSMDLVEEPGAHQRQREYLDKSKREAYTFKKGEAYSFDFCTPYLELSSQLAVKLPGFTFDVGKYAGKTELRYVLKDGDDLVFRVSLNVIKEDDIDAKTETKTETDAKADTKTEESKPSDTKASGTTEPAPAADVPEIDGLNEVD